MGVGSNESAAAGFRLRCGAVHLLSNDRMDEGGNSYATTGLHGLSFLHHAATELSCPEFLCRENGTRSTTSIA